jgi:hypothetical protein
MNLIARCRRSIPALPWHKIKGGQLAGVVHGEADRAEEVALLRMKTMRRGWPLSLLK